MSNMLFVRRVKVQNLDEQGNPIGNPTYGVMASDDYEQAYNDTYDTFAELDAAIREQGSCLAIVAGEGEFSDITAEVGFENYEGPAFAVDPEDEDSVIEDE